MFEIGTPMMSFWELVQTVCAACGPIALCVAIWNATRERRRERRLLNLVGRAGRVRG
jgi:hypothetical protein